GERDHRRRSAECRRHRRTVEIVCADDPGRGALLDMTMAVDPARQDEAPGCIDLLRTGTEAFPKRRDDTVLDANIADCCIGGGSYRAVADYQIEAAHVPSLHGTLQRLFYRLPVKRYC